MKTYTFEELKDELLVELKKLDESGLFGKDRNLELLEGFSYVILQPNVGEGNYTLIPKDSRRLL